MAGVQKACDAGLSAGQKISEKYPIACQPAHVVFYVYANEESLSVAMAGAMAYELRTRGMGVISKRTRLFRKGFW